MTIVSHTKAPKRLINITRLTEREELRIKDGQDIYIVRDGIKYKIKQSSIICFGTIDLSTDSDDYYDIEDLDLLAAATEPFHMPSPYDYKTHATVLSDTGRSYRYTETYNGAQVAQYLHACIGKPERILIFIHYV